MSATLPPIEEWEDALGQQIGEEVLDNFIERLGGVEILTYAVMHLREESATMTRLQRHRAASVMEEAFAQALYAIRIGEDDPEDPHCAFTAAWSLIRFLEGWSKALGPKNGVCFSSEAAKWIEVLTIASEQHNAEVAEDEPREAA